MKNSKGFVFVLMPFDSQFEDVYHFGIKKTCNDLNFYCERVDEQVFEGTILTRIYNQIRTADLIIADMSKMNPNVFYETGYAHALEKDVILLTQNVENIPFDLKHYPHIVYDNIKILNTELSKKLHWFSEQKVKRSHDHSSDIEIFNNGKLVKSDSVIIANWVLKNSNLYKSHVEEDYDEHEVNEKAELKITLNIFNKGFTKIDNISDFGLILKNVFYEEKFLRNDSYSLIKLPDNNVLLKIDNYYELFPQTWSTIEIDLGEKRLFKEEIKTCTLRIIKEGIIQDIPLKIEYKIHRILTNEFDLD